MMLVQALICTILQKLLTSLSQRANFNKDVVDLFAVLEIVE